MKIEVPSFKLAVVSASNFRREVLQKKIPVLLAYLRQGQEYNEQLGVVENIARHYGAAMKVCLVAQEDLEAISEACNTTGTPAFLFFRQGKENGRLLGQVSNAELKVFIDNSTDCET